ncbi:MAG TPA: GNAT family N-acetyltransferase [Mycobacteriales bacterium]|nr:GNAT family N-acetyltransferase [Mycobacteriales bacterium]
MRRYDELPTERLLLRRWRDADREPFAALNADPVVMEHFPAPLTREESDALVDRIEAHFQAHGYGLWAVEHDGDFLGFTGLSWAQGMPMGPCLEVGWRLARHGWGHGYATEAARAALEVGLQHEPSVVSFTAVSNERSWRVMERVGMRREGVFEHPRVPEGSPLRTHYLYRTA